MHLISTKQKITRKRNKFWDTYLTRFKTKRKTNSLSTTIKKNCLILLLREMLLAFTSFLIPTSFPDNNKSNINNKIMISVCACSCFDGLFCSCQNVCLSFIWPSYYSLSYFVCGQNFRKFSQNISVIAFNSMHCAYI